MLDVIIVLLVVGAVIYFLFFSPKAKAKREEVRQNEEATRARNRARGIHGFSGFVCANDDFKNGYVVKADDGTCTIYDAGDAVQHTFTPGEVESVTDMSDKDKEMFLHFPNGKMAGINFAGVDTDAAKAFQEAIMKKQCEKGNHEYVAVQDHEWQPEFCTPLTNDGYTYTECKYCYKEKKKDKVGNVPFIPESIDVTVPIGVEMRNGEYVNVGSTHARAYFSVVRINQTIPKLGFVCNDVVIKVSAWADDTKEPTYPLGYKTNVYFHALDENGELIPINQGAEMSFMTIDGRYKGFKKITQPVKFKILAIAEPGDEA